MFLSNPAKSFLASLLVLLSTTGCGLVGSGGDTAGPAVDLPKSRIPFRTKEPENFQCDIIETAGETIRRKRLAKKGPWRRVDFDTSEKTHRAVLLTDKEYIIDIGHGVYAETPAGTGGQFSELTHELLNAAQLPDFAETGRQGTVVRYTVHPTENGMSEIVIEYDESIGLPVKQEFFTTGGGARTLQFTFEMVNFKNEPDADAFSIPPGFRKISMTELLNPSTK